MSDKIIGESIYGEKITESGKTEMLLLPFQVYKTMSDAARSVGLPTWRFKALIGKTFAVLSVKNAKGEEVIVWYASMLEMAKYVASFIAFPQTWLDIRVKTKAVADKRKQRVNKYFYADGRPKWLIVKNEHGEEFVRPVKSREYKDIPKFQLIRKYHYGKRLSRYLPDDEASIEAGHWQGGSQEEETKKG